MNATASFGGAGGLHGTAGVTTSASTPAGSPQDYITTIATEIGALCDVFVFSKTTGVCQSYNFGTAICSIGGLLFSGGGFGVSLPYQVEGAFTQAYWNGAPAPSCTPERACTYAVHNNCTAATTPPDMGMATITSGDFVGVATYVSWMNAGACIRFSQVGPWTCTPALSFINSMNATMPPFACTHNP